VSSKDRSLRGPLSRTEVTPVSTKRLVAALLAALVGLAGCGVPGRSEPRTAGTAPGVNDPGPGGSNLELPSPNGVYDPAGLVERFFQAAAAGDVDPTLRDQRIETATRYVKDFLAQPAAQEWKPDAQVVVVDVTRVEVAGDSVKVTLRSVGVLDEWGAIEPLSEGAADPVPTTLTLQVETRAGGSELRIKNDKLPQVLMLSTAALERYYEGRAVYFWDTSGRYLVPDRRYLNRQVNAQKRARAVAERLLAGPSHMIQSAVNTLPGNLTINSNPVVENNRVTVNLSAPAALEQSDLSRLAMQLRWSLFPATDSVEIQIDSRTRHVEEGPEYLTRNPTYRVQAAGDASQHGLFGVVGGKAVRVQSTAAPMPVLAEEHNSNVVAAAVNPDRKTAALVRQMGNRQELWFVREGPEGAGAGGVNAFPVTFPAEITTMGRPVYLPGSKGRFLVPAQGRLFDVTSDPADRNARPVNLLDRTLKAISVAPDGRRLAMIVVDKGGAEHVVVGTVNPDANPVILSDKRTLDLDGLTDMRGVAWLLEHQLVVSGANWLTEVTVDNSARNKWLKPNFDQFPVTAVAVVPRPANGIGPMAIEGGSGNNLQAYWVFTETLRPVAPASASPGNASPSPGANGQPVRGPFYPDLAPD